MYLARVKQRKNTRSAKPDGAGLPAPRLPIIHSEYINLRGNQKRITATMKAELLRVLGLRAGDPVLFLVTEECVVLWPMKAATLDGVSLGRLQTHAREQAEAAAEAAA